ncbi:isochorismatase family [Fusarium acutatum]|uniref:Isochorismatase family n=1 Tax=Fusarium acutatum TaxID=78861 RepID=A0A8H4NGY4_9HYPO|nr:isochorismatase family [Fusarium acutatum]
MSRLSAEKFNFWLWTKKDGFELTHPPTPDSPPIYPRINLNTRAEKATIDPAKTALVVIDMQKYFLSPLIGRPPKSPGLEIVDKLVKQAIPVCRKAGILVIWLGWDVKDSDLDDMPPSVARGFDFPLDKNLVKPTFLGSIGAEIGQVECDDERLIDAGRVMMRDQWNTEFHASLKRIVEPQDIHINKNRLSGFWGRNRYRRRTTQARYQNFTVCGGEHGSVRRWDYSRRLHQWLGLPDAQ